MIIKPTFGKSPCTTRALTATLAFVAATLPSSLPLRAQLLHPTNPLPSFEVATIKPIDPKVPVMIGPLGSQQIVHVAGRELGLVGIAFNAPGRSWVVPGFGLGIGWRDSSILYVVEAKIPDETFTRMQTMTAAERKEQTQLMLQSLLAERFNLKTHFASQEMPIYELVLDKGGSKLPAPNEPPIAAGSGWAMSPAGGHENPQYEVGRTPAAVDLRPRRPPHREQDRPDWRLQHQDALEATEQARSSGNGRRFLPGDG